MTPQTLFADASKSFQRGRYTEALGSLNQLLDFSKDAKTYALLAKTFVALNFKEEAARTYTLAAEQGGSRAEDHYIEAMKLYMEVGQDDIALSLGLPLLQRSGRDPDLAFMIASLLFKRGEKEVTRAFLPVLAASENTKHNNLAFLLLTGSPEDNTERAALGALLAKMPHSLPVIIAHLVSHREINNYDEMQRLQPQLDRILKNNVEKLVQVDSPFYNLMWLADEAINKKVGHMVDAFPADHPKQRLTAPHSWGKKIRIGYLSSDFWQHHATMKLCGAVMEAHDRDRFEITLFCYTDPTHLEDGASREKWGKVVSVRDMTSDETAQTIRDHNIDILVEMKGHTRGGRAYILNKAAAPVQVAWLGFPGTTVNVDLDYIIGDHSVLPDKAKPHYWEKFCRLPENYQPNNPNQARARTDMFTRAEAGLADDAFVFASFNATRKISRETIDLWTRILKATPKSLLWVMVKSREAETNILRRFTNSGIDGTRIVFTKMVPYEAHLSRITLADVGLDPFPCNGHTTTSEQLWAGLPVLTKEGTHFSSRVTESLLRAIDLPEMVAKDEEEYFRLAVDLYENPEKARAYRERLEQNRFVKPLFDAERFCRHLEAGFEMMAERARNGLGPDHIDVPALPPRETSFL